ISVNLTLPERETLDRQTDFAARIEASQTVKVFPETGGTVSKVYFNVGDKVNKGDLLFELDSTDAETSLRKAELDYQKTMANLESEETGSGNATTIRNYEDKIRSAQIKYESARESLEADVEDDFSMSEFKRAFERYRKADRAYAEVTADDSTATQDEKDAAWAEYVTSSAKYNDFIDGYGSYTKYKAQVTSLENAYIDYLNAIEDYEIYKSMTEGEKAAARDISREQAEISLKTAKDNLADHKVYAPVSGVVSAKTISEFDNASANSAAYTISQEGMPCVSFNLSEDGANAMDIGTPITVWYNGKEYPAEVTELSPEADSTGLYPAKA
ncbi:MAG: biotin/lipoyl-binding protein, partial [Oscillospiraceae bacterium]|nr:biotin/lipoyl-binding protein [Oscillospiraceae bacterium]